MLHCYAVGGGRRGCGDFHLSLKRKGFRFPTASSQPMALTRPPGDGVSRREIVYQNLTRGARHPAPTLARFEPATSPDRRAQPRFRRVSRQSRSCGAAPAANNRGFRQNLPKTLFRNSPSANTLRTCFPITDLSRPNNMAIWSMVSQTVSPSVLTSIFTCSVGS